MHGPEPFQMEKKSLFCANILTVNESEKKREAELQSAQATQETNARLNETTQRSIDEVTIEFIDENIKMYKEFGEANLFKKMFSSRSQSVRRVKAGGQTIFKGHREL